MSKIRGLKPELKGARLTLAIEPSLDKKVRAYAKRHKVSKAQAVRFMLASFFDGDYEKIVAGNDEIVGVTQS